MGYTHYWERKQAEIPLNKWQQAIERIRPIIEANTAALGLTDIEVTDDVIFFNGQHETFVVRRVLGPGQYTFCKTAHKRYDAAVIACLLILDYTLAGEPVGFQWSSDGNWPEEHASGIELSGLPQDDLRGPRK